MVGCFFLLFLVTLVKNFGLYKEVVVDDINNNIFYLVIEIVNFSKFLI